MLDLDVIDKPASARVLLDPAKTRVLGELAEPSSATMVAKALDEPRQRVNYHLRALEDHGLVRLVEQRQRRGLTERVMIASARSYVLSPTVLGDRAADPARTDRLSARYLVAVAARIVQEVADLIRQADKARKPLATLTIDTEIRFASAADRSACTEELAAFVASLVARYHRQKSPSGRWHRLVVAAHPRPRPNPPDTERKAHV